MNLAAVTCTLVILKPFIASRYILEVNSGSGYEQVYSGPDTEAVCDRLTPGTTYQLRVSCASAGKLKTQLINLKF